MSNAKNRVWQKRNGTPRQTTDGSGRAFFRLLFVRKNSYRVRDFQENWRKRLNKNQKSLSFWQVKAIKERKIEKFVWCHRENVSLLGAGHTTAVWITVCRNFLRFGCEKVKGRWRVFSTSPGVVFTSPRVVFTSPGVVRTSPGLVRRTSRIVQSERGGCSVTLHRPQPVLTMTYTCVYIRK